MPNGDSILIAAARNGSENVVELLINNPLVDINFQDTNGDTAAIIALKLGNNFSIMFALTGHPEINLNLTNNQGISARQLLHKLEQPKAGRDRK